MSATVTDSPTTIGEPARTRRLSTLLSSTWFTVAGGLTLAAVVIYVCTYPMIDGRAGEIRGGGFVGYDWFAHLWYVWHQEGSLKAHLLPSFFAHNSTGVFDPHFAFYGGTLYTITGAVALVLGHDAAYVASWIWAFMMAYGGLYWMARQAGVRAWPAHIPSIVFVTSPWYLSSIYVWGSWGQNTAFSALLLVLAAGFSIMRADRLRFFPALALAVGVLFFTGSHSLTLAWASTAMTVLGLVFLALVPAFRRMFNRRGLLRIAAVAIPAGLVNAWFMVPAIAYQGKTWIGTNYDMARGLLLTSMYYVEPQHILALTRTRADPGSPHLALQLPLLAAIWLVIGLVLVRPHWRSQWLRTAVLMLAAGVAMWQLMTHSSWILGLPHPYDQIQAPYRLESYINIAVAGALIATLALLARSRSGVRRWSWVMLPILVLVLLQVGAQLRESWGPGSFGPQWNTAAPYLTNDVRLGMADYVNSDVPEFQAQQRYEYALFSARDAEHNDRGVAVVDAQPGEYVASNLKVSNPLIKVQGASIVARDQLGNAFLQVDSDAKPGAARIVVTAAHPFPVVLGRILTLVGLLGLAAVGLTLLLRGRRPSARDVT
ncbi:hypothetical protein [Baekduia sp.]|jgi:hypothetical protein|uniref:hypothetical protein n=1 Tax=Baekduia sp. TaxID=2600305 RepID=UPI002E04A395|nr:hypothetical protein [Baekduia sp.]